MERPGRDPERRRGGARVGLAQLPGGAGGRGGPGASWREWGGAALAPSGRAVACWTGEGGGWVAGLRGGCTSPRWEALPPQSSGGGVIGYAGVRWAPVTARKELLVTLLSGGRGLAFHVFLAGGRDWRLKDAAPRGMRGRDILLDPDDGLASCSFFIEAISNFLAATCVLCKEGRYSLLGVEASPTGRNLVLFCSGSSANSPQEVAVAYSVEPWGLRHVRDLELRNRGEESFTCFSVSGDFVFGLCPSGNVSGFQISSASRLFSFSAKARSGVASIGPSFDKLAVSPDRKYVAVGSSSSRAVFLFGTESIFTPDSAARTALQAQESGHVHLCAADLLSASLEPSCEEAERNMRDVLILPFTGAIETISIAAGTLVVFSGGWTHCLPLHAGGACEDDRSSTSRGDVAYGRPVLSTQRHLFCLNDSGIEISSLLQRPHQSTPGEPAFLFPADEERFDGLEVDLLLQIELVFGSAIVLHESGALSRNDALVRILLLKKCLELDDSINFQRQLKAVASGQPRLMASAIQHVMCAVLEFLSRGTTERNKIDIPRILKYASSCVAQVLKQGDFGQSGHQRRCELAEYLRSLRALGRRYSKIEGGQLPRDMFAQRTFTPDAPRPEHDGPEGDICQKSERRSGPEIIVAALEGGLLSRAIGELRSSGTAVSGQYVRRIALDHTFNQLVRNEPDAAIKTLLGAGLAPVNMLGQLLRGSVSRNARNAAVTALESLDPAVVGKELGSEVYARLEKLEAAFPCEDFQQAVSWNRSSHEPLESSRSVASAPFVPCDFMGCTVGAWPLKQLSVAGLDSRSKNSSGASPGSGGHCNFLKVAPSWLSSWGAEEDDLMLLEAAYLSGADIAEFPVPWATRLKFCVAHCLLPELESVLDEIPREELVPGALCIAGPGSKSEDITVQVLGADALPFCCGYVRRLLEEKLSASGNFLQLYWPCPLEFVSFMARSGSIATHASERLSEIVASSSAELCDCLDLHNSLWAILSSSLFGQEGRIFSLLREEASLGALTKWMLASRLPGAEMQAGFLAARWLWGANDTSTSSGQRLASCGAEVAAKGHPLAFLSSYVYRPLDEPSRHEDLELALDSCRERFPVLKVTCKHLERLSRGTSPLGSFSGETLHASEKASKAWENWHSEILLGSSSQDWSCLDYLPRGAPSLVTHLLHGLLQGPRAAQAAALWSKTALSADSGDGFASGFVQGTVAWEVETWREAKKNFYLRPDASPALAIQSLLQHGRALGALSCFARTVGEQHSLEAGEMILSARRTAALHYHNAPAAAASCLVLELLGEPVQAWCARVDIAALQEVESQALGPGGQGGLGAAAAASLAQALVSSSEGRGDNGAQGGAAARQLVHVICEGVTRRLRADPSAESRESAGRAWRLARALSESHCLIFSSERDLAFLSGIAERGDWLRLLAEATALKTSPRVVAAAVQSLPSTPMSWHILHALNLSSPTGAVLGYMDDTFGESVPELLTYAATVERAAKSGESSPLVCQGLWRDAIETRWPLLAIIASSALASPETLSLVNVQAQDSRAFDAGSHAATLRVASANAYAWLCATAPPQWVGMVGGAPESAAVLLSGDHSEIVKRLSFAARAVAQSGAAGAAGAALIRALELCIGGAPGGGAAIDSARAVQDFALRRSPLHALQRLRAALLDYERKQERDGREGYDWPELVARESLVGALRGAWSAGRAGEFLGRLVQSRLLGSDLPGAPPEPYEADPALLEDLRPAALAVAFLDQSELQGVAGGGCECSTFYPLDDSAQSGVPDTPLQFEHESVLRSLESAGRWEEARIWARESRGEYLAAEVTLRQAWQGLHVAASDPYAWDLRCVRDSAFATVQNLLSEKNLAPGVIAGFTCSLAWGEGDVCPQRMARLSLAERSKLLLSAAGDLEPGDARIEVCKAVLMRKGWLLRVEGGCVEHGSPPPPLEIDADETVLESSLPLEKDCLGWLLSEDLGHSESLIEGVLQLLDEGHVDWAERLAGDMRNPPTQLAAVFGALRLWRWGSFDPNMSLSEFLPGEVEVKVSSILRDREPRPAGLRGSERSCLQGFSRSDILKAIGAVCGPGMGLRICEKLAVAVSTSELLRGTLDRKVNVLQCPLRILRLLLEHGSDGASIAKSLVKVHDLDSVSVARCVSEVLKVKMTAEVAVSESAQYIDSSMCVTGVCDSPLELGNALLGTVLEGRDLCPDVEVVFVLLAHHYYCVAGTVDGLEVLVTLARERSSSYIESKNFKALARLVLGLIRHPEMHVGLDLLIKNDRMEELLQRRAASGPFGNSPREAIMRSAIMASLHRCRPGDREAVLMLDHHFSRPRRVAEIAQDKALKMIRSGNESKLDKDRYPLLASGISLLADAASGFEAAGCPRRSRKCSQEANRLAQEVLKIM